jgi:hypothetical protein
MFDGVAKCYFDTKSYTLTSLIVSIQISKIMVKAIMMKRHMDISSILRDAPSWKRATPAIAN